MNDDQAIHAFAALANETRLAVFKLLVTAGPSGLPAGTIAERLGASPSRMSFHLATLSDAGVLSATKHARRINYAVNFERMGRLVQYLLKDCCRDHPAVARCCQ